VREGEVVCLGANTSIAAYLGIQPGLGIMRARQAKDNHPTVYGVIHVQQM
jgi:hypothetical protein